MDDKTVLAEHANGKLRVVAERDDYPHQPENQGWPELIIGWDRGWSYMTSSWSGVINERAITRAVEELAPGYDYDLLARWLRIHAADLVDWDGLGFSADELDSGVTVNVDTANGYSQGDVWLVIQWRPMGSRSKFWTEWDADESELVNWARGDAWGLVAEEYDADADYWDSTGVSVWGYFAQWPEDSDYMRDSAEDVLAEAHGEWIEREQAAARRYYETLEVTR